MIPATAAQRLGRGLLRGAAASATTISSRRIIAATGHHQRGRILWSAPRALQQQQVRRLTETSTTFSDQQPGESGTYSEADREHAVISTFDLFSIGIGPSSSHTVGPMRAGSIFVADLVAANLLHKVHKIRVTIYGSLALTGEGHMTPSALLLGLESADVETVDTFYVPKRFDEIKATRKLHLGKGLGGGDGKEGREIDFDYKKDFIWEWSKKLPLHSNGMRLMVFDENGDMLATNDMFSVGGGFVVNGAMSTAATAASAAADSDSPHPVDLAENMFYKEINRTDAAGSRRTGTEVIAPPEIEEAPVDSGKMLHSGEESKSTETPEEEEEEEEEKPKNPSALVSAASTAAAKTEPAETESATGPPQPRYPFRDAATLLAMCKKHNLTIAQLVYENEKSQGYTDEEIHEKLFRIWEVMDNSILEAVQAPLNTTLPGSLKLHRRAPALYKRLTRGLYPSHTDKIGASSGSADGAAAQILGPDVVSGLEGPSEGLTELTRTRTQSSPSPSPSTTTSSPSSSPTRSSRAVAAANKRNLPMVHGSLTHPILPSPRRRTSFPAMDYLTVYAIAVNETNACGGRVVTAPTNGAAGIIPSVLKYTLEFISDTDDPDRDIVTFLLTAAAIGMIFKRGATISAAEGGCMAEVGVACSMAAAGFAAVHGASVETIEMAAEIGIEHNLGLSCDPIASLVQAPCIERNALGSIKAVSSANLALSSNPQTMKVRLDDAVRAMRLTAIGMRSEFKETSLSGLATSVPIPVSVPDC